MRFFGPLPWVRMSENFEKKTLRRGNYVNGGFSTLDKSKQKDPTSSPAGWRWEHHVIKYERLDESSYIITCFFLRPLSFESRIMYATPSGVRLTGDLFLASVL